MNIDDLTLGEAKQLASMFSNNKESTLNCQLGEYVIIRTYSAGVWCGVLDQKSGNEVILKNARRMWKWWAKEGIALSGVALSGIKHDSSKICAPVNRVWLEAIEIITLTATAIESLKGAPHVQAE